MSSPVGASVRTRECESELRLECRSAARRGPPPRRMSRPLDPGYAGRSRPDGMVLIWAPPGHIPRTPSMSRLLELPPEQLTAEQKDVFDKLTAGRGRILGPYKVWIHSPTVAAG